MESLAWNAIFEVDHAMQASIPSECLASYAFFPWETLSDDLLSTSLAFSQQNNLCLLQPLQ